MHAAAWKARSWRTLCGIWLAFLPATCFQASLLFRTPFCQGQRGRKGGREEGKRGREGPLAILVIEKIESGKDWKKRFQHWAGLHSSFTMPSH